MADLAALQGQAETIVEAVRNHKRAASHHRRQARTLMRKLELIERECARQGIHLQITQTPGRESQ